MPLNARLPWSFCSSGA